MKGGELRNMVDVFISPAGEIGIEKAIEQIFRHFNPDLKDKIVLIKPNMVKAVTGDSGINTHPEIVRELVGACKKRRAAEIIVGDNPGGMTKGSKRIAQVTGMMEASQGHFEILGEEVAEYPVHSKYTSTILISKRIMEADFIINVPIFKTHIFTLISGAFKNVYGYVAGANKAQLHYLAPTRREFAEILVTINKIRPPDLHVMDALTVMDEEGPSKGRVRPFGKILASTDGIAVDAIMSHMAGINPEELPFLVLGNQEKLGELEQKNINIIGKFTIIPDFRLPSTFYRETRGDDEISIASRDLIKARASVMPKVNEKLCAKCSYCELNCPAKCIDLKPYPVIEVKKCISCFCCVELCPEEAFEVEHITLYGT